MNSCRHQWTMTNIRAGYLVFEGCPGTAARASFFSTEAPPPLEEFQRGDELWISMGEMQAVKFDLRCIDCAALVDLSDMNALMLSTCEDADCAVGELARNLGPDSWVYVAICSDPTHRRGRCITEEGIQALNEYFNQDPAFSDRNVMVVPCRVCNSIDRCKGIVVADVGLTELS